MSSELDKIIDEGKVSSATAMVVFAVELKSQGDKIDELKKAINDDNQRYASLKDQQKLDSRVGRLENGALGLLVFVFVAVFGALIALVIKGNQ